MAFIDNLVDRSLSISSATEAEGNSGTKNFTFTISADPESLSFLEKYSDIDFDYDTRSSTAHDYGNAFYDIDYTSVTGHGHIDADGQTITVNVSIHGDSLSESDEKFFLDISNVRYSSGHTGPSIFGTGTILNDDAPNSLQVFFTGPPSIDENTTSVGSITIVDPHPIAGVRYSIGGADADKFIVDRDTGLVSFRNAPDFETPLGQFGTNIYQFIVTAQDGPLLASAHVTVRVDDVPGVDHAGDAGNNVLIGTTEADTLNGLGGNDTLQGLGGDDQLAGGAGDDLLDGGGGTDTASYADSAKAVKVDLSLEGIQNTGGAGKDTLIGVESLIGTDRNDTLHGNDARNVLSGGDGKDRLDGGANADLLIGGFGDDIYTVDDSGDVVVEDQDGGNDRVYASVDFTLSDNVEALVLTGNVALTGIGNMLDNQLAANDAGGSLFGGEGNDKLMGGDGADRLNGGKGSDLLIGGAGADTFVFDNREFSNRLDTIKDFVSGFDHIEFAISAFPGLYSLGTGSLDAGELSYGKAATTADQHLYYDRSGGTLYYDTDGSRGASPVVIAILAGHPDLQFSDIVLV